jgi:hypothetical protein
MTRLKGAAITIRVGGAGNCQRGGLDRGAPPPANTETASIPDTAGRGARRLRGDVRTSPRSLRPTLGCIGQRTLPRPCGNGFTSIGPVAGSGRGSLVGTSVATWTPGRREEGRQPSR